MKSDDPGYYLGWFLAFGIAAIIFVYLVWNGPQFQSIACSADEQNCFREWLSALGAWAALSTVLYLSKQIKDADRHHKTTMKVQVRRNRGVAQNVVDHASHISALAQNWKVIYGSPGAPDIFQLKSKDDFLHVIDDNLKIISGRTIETFENMIHLPLDDSRFIREVFVEIKNDISLKPDDLSADDVAKACKDVHKSFVIFDSYLNELAASAKKYLDATREYA